MKAPWRSPCHLVVLVLAVLASAAGAATYHLDSIDGRDSNDGLSAATAWKSLAKASGASLAPGDAILLKRGCTFTGCLRIGAHGSQAQPVTVASYGSGAMPVINASGYIAGVHLDGAQNVVVQDVEVVADGGRMVDGSPEGERFGVFVDAASHVTLRGLFLHDIYPAVGRQNEGKRPTTHLGDGIAIRGGEDERSEDVAVERCRIERTGFKAIEMKRVNKVRILDNRMKDIGGPAIQPREVDDLIVRGNVVDGSGSNLDPRMHARGSGIWPWGSKRVLIEKNTFMHARGKADSCGIHIDFNCRDVVVQYNLSIDNEGGFIEILGNNFNCAYRYNISVNDGARVKGENGAGQEGKILWTSGFVGRNRPKTGPTNSYIYNNTIYVGPNSRSCFSIAPTTQGLLIANNVFCLMGTTADVLGDQDRRQDRRVKSIPRTDVRNNLYIRADLLPPGMPFHDANPLVGDPQFARPGGTTAADYIPANRGLIHDRGIVIPRLEGDDVGLRMGLAVQADILGNPIEGLPDIGAIELTTPASN